MISGTATLAKMTQIPVQPNPALGNERSLPINSLIMGSVSLSSTNPNGVLILFVIVATFYAHDFWNQSGPEQNNNMIHALKNLSLIGGLFIIAGIGRGRRSDPGYTDV